MKNIKYLYSLILILPLVLAAQDSDDSNNSEVEEVVVVGSQIKGAKITGALPVTISRLKILKVWELNQVKNCLQN